MDQVDQPQPSVTPVRLLALAVIGLFRKQLRADAAFVLLDAVPVRCRRGLPFRVVTRYVKIHWWGWPPSVARGQTVAEGNADDVNDHALGHSWTWDEDTNGHNYRFCTRCKRDEQTCRPNEFHGPIACTGSDAG